MRLEVRKYLYNIKQAADLLGEFTGRKQFSDYQENSMLRAAVERKFEIIGEALSKLSKADSAIASHIGEHARIIAFRNILNPRVRRNRRPARLGHRGEQATGAVARSRRTAGQRLTLRKSESPGIDPKYRRRD